MMAVAIELGVEDTSHRPLLDFSRCGLSAWSPSTRDTSQR